MKWILLIIPLIVKQLTHSGVNDKSPIDELKELSKENGYKILIILSASFTTTSIFIFGFLITTLNITAQIDAGIKPKLTAVGTSGLMMIMLSSILFSIGIYYSKANERKISKSQIKNKVHPLESALILLINDFVQEREFKRDIIKNDTAKSKSKEENIINNEAFERH